VVCPILPHKAPLDRAQVLKAAANFNRYGAALKAAGLRFAYHNHAGDFMVADSPAAPGETFYDVLIAATESGVVSFQLDVFWVVWGGANATEVIEKHGRRICSLHLKDLARDAKADVANPKSARSFMVRLAAARRYSSGDFRRESEGRGAFHHRRRKPQRWLAAPGKLAGSEASCGRNTEPEQVVGVPCLHEATC